MVIVFQPALQRGSGVDDLKQTECGFGLGLDHGDVGGIRESLCKWVT